MANRSAPIMSKLNFPKVRPTDTQITDMDSSNPLLLLANLGNTSYPDDPQWNVYNFGKNTSIQIGKLWLAKSSYEFSVDTTQF